MQRTFNLGYATVFEKCTRALEDLEMRVKVKDKKKGIIQASTGSSLLSWGEDINITFHEIDSRKTKIIVESEASAQLITWGKNDTNARNIINAIEKLLK